MAGSGDQASTEVVLLKSEIEAAAARVAERAMNDTWTGTSGFISDVFGGLVGDRTKLWRTRNLINSLAKTADHLEAQGVAIDKAKPLPMGELLVLFEGASRTDDTDLSTMWAALLSNGMNPDKDTFIDPSFPRLLADLSGLDARILNYHKSFQSLALEHREKVSPLFRHGARFSVDEDYRLETNAQIMRHEQHFLAAATALRDEIVNGYSALNVTYSLSNLLRLGLVTAGRGSAQTDDLVEAQLSIDNEIVLSAEGVRRELARVWERFDMLNEDNRSLPSLTYEGGLFYRGPTPNYDLTGLALRFLEACS